MRKRSSSTSLLSLYLIGKEWYLYQLEIILLFDTVSLHPYLCYGSNYFKIFMSSNFFFFYSTINTAGPWTLSLCSVSFCYNIDGEKKSVPSCGHCLSAYSPPCLRGLSLDSLVSSHIPELGTWGELVCLPHPSPAECGWMGMWMALGGKGILSSVGSHLAPWAAATDSRHLWAWTGTGRSEKLSDWY